MEKSQSRATVMAAVQARTRYYVALCMYPLLERLKHMLQLIAKRYSCDGVCLFGKL